MLRILFPMAMGVSLILLGTFPITIYAEVVGLKCVIDDNNTLSISVNTDRWHPTLFWVEQSLDIEVILLNEGLLVAEGEYNGGIKYWCEYRLWVEDSCALSQKGIVNIRLNRITGSIAVTVQEVHGSFKGQCIKQQVF